MKKLPKPGAARFEISVRAKLPKGALGLLRKELVNEAVNNWLETGIPENGWQINLTIWEHRRGRAISEIDDSPRGKILRAVLRRALKSGTLQIKPVGSS